MQDKNSPGVDISLRLVALVNEISGGNARNFAESANINHKTFHTNLKGRPPNTETLLYICRHYGVNLNWLVAGIEPKFISSISASEDFDCVPLAEVKLSAGNGSFVFSEKMKESYSFRKEWLRSTITGVKNAVLVNVTGNSMEPTIYDGDMVMLDRGRTDIYDGRIYALRMDDMIVIKRLALQPKNKVKVIADNKDEYPPDTYHLKDIHVIGQVVWYARTLAKAN